LIQGFPFFILEIFYIPPIREGLPVQAGLLTSPPF